MRPHYFIGLFAVILVLAGCASGKATQQHQTLTTIDEGVRAGLLDPSSTTDKILVTPQSKITQLDKKTIEVSSVDDYLKITWSCTGSCSDCYPLAGGRYISCSNQCGTGTCHIQIHVEQAS